ncbi:MAG TPA: GNAT family N-acetyltransferase [Bryobacteraceae bacterium]|nr:GNAT family N-acetyltransferase [Bryobacteraceae bacterium]
MREYLIVDENLRAAMRFFGTATGSGEIRALPGGVAIWSGLDYGVFNIAMLDSPLSPAGGLAERIAEAARFFKPRTTRWSFWLCEDYLDAHELRRARGTLADFGLRAISHPPGMFAAELAPVRGLLPPLKIEPVESASHQRAFAEITALSFEIPYSIAGAVYAHPHAWNGDYRGVVGLAEGRVVAIAATVETKDAMGIYSLATHPAYRRRGYGEALLREAVAEARRRTGPSGIVLQSTEAGHALYRRLGFRDVTRFTVYLTK